MMVKAYLHKQTNKQHTHDGEGISTQTNKYHTYEGGGIPSHDQIYKHCVNDKESMTQTRTKKHQTYDGGGIPIQINKQINTLLTM